MAKGDGESSSEKKAPRKCVYKGCHQTKGLMKSKTGNWYCSPHHPETRVKHIEGARKAAKTKREQRDSELLTLTIEPNKASILKALVLQANYLAKDIGPKELKRHRMVVELMDRIHEYATEEGDDAQKEQKVAAIMESELPEEIKLSKLTDVVGPAKACEMVKVVVTRNGYESKVLDGEQLLKEEGKGGASISRPQHFDVHETDETHDISTPDLPVVQAESGAPITAPGAAAAPAPEPEPPPVSETQDEKERRCAHQAQELMGLYRAKCPTSPTPVQAIAQSFFQGLMDGLPFKDLQGRCMFPKGDTDQPMMMVRDVKAAIEAKKKAAGQ